MSVRLSTAVEPAPAALLRRCFVALAGLAVAATAAELAAERHWNGMIQLIPWLALAVTALGVVLFVVAPTRRALLMVRGLAVAVAVSAAFGIYEHIRENYRAGPLDFRYTDRWPTMSVPARLWAAVSKAVGPSPTLAPGALLGGALLLLCATLRHPALAPADEG